MSHAPFPRSAAYNRDWLTAGVSGGANPLQLAEWLCADIPLTPGMRVLDLACGRAMSSVFLHREYGVQVWATDLWFDVSENLQRIRDAGVEASVFPIHADARARDELAQVQRQHLGERAIEIGRELIGDEDAIPV